MLPTVATHLRRPRNRPAIASVSCRTRLVRQAAAPASQTLRRCSVNSGSGLNLSGSSDLNINFSDSSKFDLDLLHSIILNSN